MKIKMIFLLVFAGTVFSCKTANAQINTDTSYRLPGQNYVDDWVICTSYNAKGYNSVNSTIPGITVTPDSFSIYADSFYFPIRMSFVAPDSGAYSYTLEDNIYTATTHIIVTDTPPGISTYNFTLQAGQEADTTVTLYNSYYNLYEASACPRYATFNYPLNYSLSVFPATNMVQFDSSTFTLVQSDTARYTIKVLGTAPGYYTYYIQSLCDSGWPLYSRINVTVTDTVAGIKALGAPADLSISPNPGPPGLFNISFNGNTPVTGRLEVYNSIGQVVWLGSFDGSGAKANRQINLGGLSKGVYILKYNEAKEVISRKLIIE